jgi:Zn finger protein HypA/HybF involved in hydrogenase expression
MTDTIELKIKDLEPPKFMCATCDNNITELRAMKLPICDECIKDLREIIKERRLEKEKAEFKLKAKKRCAELEARYFR